MKNAIMTLSVYLLTVVLCLSGFCQDGDYVTVKQDGTGDYSSIQAALDDLNRETNQIVVFAGIYKENIVIKEPITLWAYDGPNLTIIDGSLYKNFFEDVITVESNVSDVEIIGFFITGGNNGINLNFSCEALISNCVIYANKLNGIYSSWKNELKESKISILNNVISNNLKNGICLVDDRVYYYVCFPITVKNNIIVSNGEYGLYTDDEWGFVDKNNVLIDYNDFYGNTKSDYSAGIGYAEKISVGKGEISKQPLLLSEENTLSGYDVRLQSKSPCRDKGDITPPSCDPDGTRNDMGAYGGPWAATFYEAPNDGPVVRKVTVSPGSIPQGETFVIKAVGSVR